MAGAGSRFLKEGRTTPKQKGNDKYRRFNLQSPMTNIQLPILKAQSSYLD